MIIIKIVDIIIIFDHRCSDDSGKLILTEVKDGPLLQVIRMVMVVFIIMVLILVLIIMVLIMVMLVGHVDVDHDDTVDHHYGGGRGR